jgi:hypothetical protein
VFHAIAVSAVLLATVVAPVPAPAAPPPGPITIDKLAVSGTGCQPNTVAVAISDDKEAFTVTYSAYAASAGGGSAQPKEQSRGCSITVGLNIPPGVTYGVAKVDYRGFAELYQGSTAELAGRYHFTGGGKPTWTTHAFGGPQDTLWTVSDNVTSTKFGKCGKDRKLDIDTQLSVRTTRTDTPANVFAMDSTDGTVLRSTYKLAWKAC